QHDVHDANAAQAEGDNRDAAEKDGDHIENIGHHLGTFHGVPDEESIFILGIEVVRPAECATHLHHGIFMVFGVRHFEDNVVQVSLHNALFDGRWEVARNR